MLGILKSAGNLGPPVDIVAVILEITVCQPAVQDRVDLDIQGLRTAKNSYEILLVFAHSSQLIVVVAWVFIISVKRMSDY